MRTPDSYRRMHRGGVAAALLLVCSLLPLSVCADDARLPMWRMDGDTNSIYLLGSIHLLRNSDYPIPAALYDAYDDADALIMELDIDDLDPQHVQALISELGIIQGDGNLAELLGPAAFAKAARFAESADIPLQSLQRAEPWFAAITIEQLMLTRIGFNADYGIEAHFADRAATDNKEITGLESIRQQLELLDRLSIDAQRTLLLKSLEESLDIADVMESMIRAWRNGDVDYLESAILSDMRKHPELYQALVVERNRSWVKQITALLGDADDYLIVVGALHLIGPDGVPALLLELGHDVRQMPVVR